jgi:hypothetical protein
MTLSASIHCCAFSVTRRRWSRGEKQGSKEQYGIWLIESKNGLNCVSCRHVCVGAGTSFAKTRTPPSVSLGGQAESREPFIAGARKDRGLRLATPVPRQTFLLLSLPSNQNPPRIGNRGGCFRKDPSPTFGLALSGSSHASDLLSARSPTLEPQNRSAQGTKARASV